MADVALPASLASLLSPTPPDSNATTTPTSAAALPTDPFAALFAAVTASPVKTAPAEAAQPLPVAAPAIVTMAAATAPAMLPFAVETAPMVTEKTGGDDDNTDSDEQASDDPLADAIASGANAVLAFAPTIVPVPQTPVQTQTTARASLAAPVSAPAPKSISTPAPVATPVASPVAAPASTPIAIDAPMVTPRKLPIAVAAAPAPAKHPDKAALPINSTAANAPKAGDTPPDQGDSTPQQPQAQTVANASTPVTAPLSPDTMKAVIAALQQNDQAQTAPPTTPAPAATADATAPQPLPQAAEQQAAAAPVSVRRSVEQDIATRRTGGETRKRTATSAIDGAPVGLAQRAAERTPLADAPAAVAPKGDALVEQTLSIARDGAWLDTLAKDIANSAGTGNDLQFKLNPQNLGSLTVAIAQTADGASIRLTADTHETRNILLDAQPRLIAEARAQGLKVSDTHVDLNNQQQPSSQDAARWTQGNAGQNAGAQSGQNRQSSPAHQPFVSNLARKSDAETESPPSDSDALYA